MSDHPTSLEEALRQLEETRARLDEAEEQLRAIRAGEVDAIIAAGPDGSEQVYTLQGADYTYRVLVERMNQAAVIAGENGAIFYCNAKFESLTGVPSEKALSLSLESFFPESHLQEFRKLLRRSLHGDAGGELSIRGARGCLVPVYVALNRVMLGGVAATCLLLTDLTEQKRNEEIVAAGQLASAILDQMGEAAVVCDPEGKVLRASRVTEGLCRCDPVGEPFSSVFPLEIEAMGPFDLLEVHPGEGMTNTARYRSPDGRETHVLMTARSLSNEAGARLGWVVTLADITFQKEAEQELRRAREAAEAAARAKSDFLANMSHEIRTPMNAVIGFTDLLLATPLTADQRRFLDLVKNSGEALLDVVNDVLDLSKMEAGQFDFIEEPFDLRDLIEKVTRSFGVRAHQKGLELTCHVPFSLPTAVVGDPARLRQVLVNLLGNAVKFTEQGEVHLSVAEGEPTNPGDGFVRFRFSVRDTGIGIPRDKVGLLFQSFQQLDGSSTRRHEGTGLGLFISRRIVEQMGGTIRAEGEEGKGSTFTFTVPLRVRPASEAADPWEAAPELRGKKVLVVDDNATNRMILLEMLARQGMEVSVTGGGEEAIGLLRAANGAQRPYELLLVDCQMPGMNGFQLISQVKGDMRIPQPVIIMITSDDLPSYSARARQVGAAGFLVKPVSTHELFTSIRTALGGAVQEEGSLPGEDSGGPDGKYRVLLAEDNAVNQLLVRSQLESRGWSVTLAEDGRAALDALSREPFDVVLMDVQMPVMDGYEATRALRNMEKELGAAGETRRTPVIGLTARALREDRQRCLDAGMDDYLAKPTEPRALYQAIRRHVPRPPGGGERRGPPADPGPSLRDNPALLKKLTEAFLDDHPGKVAVLREAVESRSAEEIQKAAHGLLGSLLVFGAHRSAEGARRIEACAREGRLGEAPALYESLEKEIRRLADFLKERF